MTVKDIQKFPTVQETSDDTPPAQIMIVDDSRDTLNLLEDILHYHGYRTLTFTSGGKALNCASIKIPDLILLDIVIPDMDGYEVCRHLKSDNKTSGIPVIFISGHDNTVDQAKGFDAGGVDYIRKPFHITQIIARIETHLSLSRLQKKIGGQNAQLQQEIIERADAEEELLRHKTRLEELVNERTIKLRDINKELQKEINERKKLEEALEAANYKLHTLVYEYGLRNKRMTVFNQMLAQLQSCLTMKETYPVIKHFIQKFFHACSGAIFLFDREKNIFKAVTSWEATLIGKKKFAAEECLALQGGRFHICSDSRPETHCRHLPSGGQKDCLCIPMIVREETIGILHLQQSNVSKSNKPRPVSEEKHEVIDIDMKQLAITMADCFALALINIKLRDSLKKQAARDPLTGLFNRRYMEENLNREISRAERHGIPLGIIMIDLDHFRRFNNVFGHEAGDLVLHELSSFLQNNIRKEDIACRYGGEEFTLILPGASIEIARNRAETLCNEIGNLRINYNGKNLDAVTLSLGVAVYPEHGKTADKLLQAADIALYKAKRAGRRRVMVARKPGKKK